MTLAVSSVLSDRDRGAEAGRWRGRGALLLVPIAVSTNSAWGVSGERCVGREEVVHPIKRAKEMNMDYGLVIGVSQIQVAGACIFALC